MDKGKGDHWPITGAVKTSSDTCMMSNGFAELRTTLIPLSRPGRDITEFRQAETCKENGRVSALFGRPNVGAPGLCQLTPTALTP